METKLFPSDPAAAESDPATRLPQAAAASADSDSTGFERGDGFVRGLFLGRFHLASLHPFPAAVKRGPGAHLPHGVEFAPPGSSPAAAESRAPGPLQLPGDNRRLGGIVHSLARNNAAECLAAATADVERSQLCLQIARLAATRGAEKTGNPASTGPAAAELSGKPEPLGKRGAFAEKIARLAAETFAMEALTLYAADRHSRADGALEAEGLLRADLVAAVSGVEPTDLAEARMATWLCRMWTAERSGEHEDAALEILGASAGDQLSPTDQARSAKLGEDRAQRIREHAGENLMAFVARAFLAPHMRQLEPVLDRSTPGRARFVAARRTTWFYLRWYARQWLGPLADLGLMFTDLSPRLATPVRWAARASHRLARTLLHALVVHGQSLGREELLLGRLAAIGAELFAVTAVCSRAQALRTPEALELADFFCRAARLKVERLFSDLHRHTDRAGFRVAQSVLAGRHLWVEDTGER